MSKFYWSRSSSGSLLLGSSREFSGFDAEPSPDVVAAILQRAAEFLPDLAGVRPADVSVRVGPRPYAVGGLPAVGPAPGIPKLFIAAGERKMNDKGKYCEIL